MRGRKIRVTRTDTGESWNSMKQAAEALGISLVWINKCRNKEEAVLKGIPLRFEESETPPNARPVICVETGKTFPSIVQAARTVGRCPENIFVALKHRRRSGGYHWKYLEDHSDGVYEI